MLEGALAEATSQTQADKQKQKQSTDSMPPTSHTLMDLIITLSIYLPRSTFQTLFSLVTLILPQASDPQLQKKAYKLLPRLATSAAGILALQDRNTELQTLLLNSASTASGPSRRDRLAAIAVVIEHLPPLDLHFIPSILSEVVISAKEVNEKARTASFDLLVAMACKMQLGGTISQSKIPHMPADAPNADASLEEFFTMVSAGLVGSTPHMVSASITALTRVLYEFRSQLPEPVIEDLVSTMDLFLTSANREIVRSVLGFVKVTVISLPEKIVKPRLETLVPGLMSWSREHKAHFRAKVKHIFERMVRRFGSDAVERWCPEGDRKFLANIRKARERRKRKKEAGDNEGADGNEQSTRRKSRFESEYDEAVYGSDSDASSGSDAADSDTGGPSKSYIVEDVGEPLDLLSRSSMGNISSRKPVTIKPVPSKKRGKTDADGKLIFGNGNGGDTDDEDDILMDPGGDGGKDISLEAGVGAYVDAIRGRDAVQRGRGGRLKYSNKREKNQGEMEVDEEEPQASRSDRERPNGKALRGSGGRGPMRGKDGRAGKGSFGRGREGGNGRGGFKTQRRGLGVLKIRGGGVGKKSGRGEGGGRGGRGGWR